MTLEVRQVDAALLERLLPLIAGYQRFYGMEPDDERNRAFFGSLERGVQFAALEGDRPLGFVTLYVVPSSLTARPYCLLNDLFTAEEARGRGVARALVARAQAWAAEHGFAELEWLTATDNHTAQRLYDGLGAKRSAWFMYTLPAGG